VTFKATFVFESETGQGWSESYYDNSSANIANSFNSAGLLAAPRGAMCGDGSILTGYKVTDLVNPRLTMSTDFTTPTISPYDSATDNPVNNFLCRATVSPVKGNRQVWLRGMPDSWIVFDFGTGRYQLVGAFKTAFDAFRTVLIKGGWYLRTVAQAKGNGAISNIVSVDEDATTGCASLTLQAAGGTFPSTGVPAIVSGFKYPLQKLNGTYQYPAGYSISGTPAVVILRQRSATLFQRIGYVGGGQIRTAAYTYQQITNLQLVRPGNRKVGKPIGEPRGRRSGK
jgi:hypothetical protein